MKRKIYIKSMPLKRRNMKNLYSSSRNLLGMPWLMYMWNYLDLGNTTPRAFSQLSKTFQVGLNTWIKYPKIRLQIKTCEIVNYWLSLHLMPTRSDIDHVPIIGINSWFSSKLALNFRGPIKNYMRYFFLVDSFFFFLTNWMYNKKKSWFFF